MINQTDTKTVLEQFVVVKRGVSYRRVSTDEQADKGHSLPAQLAEIQTYAARNGIEFVGEPFYDDYTGSSLNRPGLQQALKWLREGRADCIVIFDSDRLTRQSVHNTTTKLALLPD